ncbi:MAG: acetoacetate--CoA ligase [Chloroflexota bacterium]|nr:acetoacetate--CoA ligase [Chloroflexota bacterium]
MNAPDAPLWQPSQARQSSSAMARFWRAAEAHTGQRFADYAALHRWSVEYSADFWSFYADFAGVHFTDPPVEIKGPDRMPGTEWFRGATLNYAEHMLRRSDDKVALIHRTESGETHRRTYAELRSEVGRCASALRQLGVEPGDRVAGYLVNGPETVIAFLACASIGAIWSACSPDFGVAGARDRLGQIEPRVVITSDRYFYNSRRFECLATIQDFSAGAPSIQHVVVVPFAQSSWTRVPHGWLTWRALLDLATTDEPEFTPLPFDHPLYILYSSGTTGVPKCLVHGAGGTLLQHRKEHQLHTDLRPDDTIVYFTTCGWMMWNWLVSALATGCTLVLYEGSLNHPDLSTAWRLAEELGVTVFGTSASFMEACMRDGIRPSAMADLSALRTLLSTGSPLSPEAFRWVYANVNDDLHLASISGGTDIVSCFVLGNPLLPVYAGEIQCAGLGMDVAAFDERGNSVRSQQGELVCRRPFPSMPVRFWNDPDGERYRASYFETYPGVWRHGDFVEITPRGGIVILGRSDAILMPGGVRIGTAEIYRPIETIPQVVAGLATTVRREGRDEIVLFVVVRPQDKLDEALRETIQDAIRRSASPRHVPRHVLAVPDLPRTRNGKLAELAVTRILRNEPVTNRESLVNPECLAAFESLRPQLLAAEPVHA